MTVTDKDREAAKRFVYDYNVRDIFGSRPGPIEDLADILAAARAEGAASEREACAAVLDAKESACMDLAASEPENAQRAWAGAAQWRSGAKAIRARGEQEGK